ncbi:hypothetical protein OR1_03500 [Geobacter sp. OR-1]|uniref:hypothetical protein n=1 Tax=Geobacter sp. OR-1 TaxID=1266765 RepID=UPI000541D5B5|nr:hypothetical protein [Geobacter sp. OR-1]GAM11190.1 hypothetical protein OR1_03500 [Geobacter sp. OR-1]
MSTKLSRTIVITVIAICLAAPLAWGGCGSEGCNEARPETQAQDAAPAAPTANPEQYQSRSREMNISDFVSSERSPEKKGCSEGGCNEARPTQEQSRTQEKKCNSGSDCN